MTSLVTHNLPEGSKEEPQGAFCARCAALQLERIIPGLHDGSTHHSYRRRVASYGMEHFLEIAYVIVDAQCERATCSLCRILHSFATDRFAMQAGDSVSTYIFGFLAYSAVEEWRVGSFVLCPAMDNFDELISSRPFLSIVANADLNSTIGVARLTHPYADLDLLKSWITTCEKEHASCGTNVATQNSPFQLSLIDCRARTVVSGSLRSKYAALSYVWGTDTTYPVQTSTILPRIMPILIEDAMAVAMRLGLDHLWVDKYCISSADEDLQHRQIQHMDDIYSHATITIVSLARGTSQGLPAVGDVRCKEQQVIKCGQYSLALIRPDPSNTVFNSPWARRAWTLQEGALSQRIVCFTDDQMYYECHHSSRSDTVILPAERAEMNRLSCDPSTAEVGHYYASSIRFGAGTHFLSGLDLSLNGIWLLCSKYCDRELTFESDAMNAFLGILHRYKQPPMNYRHYWGVVLPMTTQVPQALAGAPLSDSGTAGSDMRWPAKTTMTLSWTFVQLLKFSSYHWSPGSRRKGFPSWSWLGWRSASLTSPYVAYLRYRSLDEYYSAPSMLDASLLIEAPDGTWASIDDLLETGVLDVSQNKLRHRIRVLAWAAPVLTVLLPPEEDNNIDDDSNSGAKYFKRRCAVSFRFLRGDTLLSPYFPLPFNVSQTESNPWFAVCFELPSERSRKDFIDYGFLLVSADKVDESQAHMTGNFFTEQHPKSNTNTTSHGGLTGERLAWASVPKTLESHAYPEERGCDHLNMQNFTDIPWTRQWVELR